MQRRRHRQRNRPAQQTGDDEGQRRTDCRADDSGEQRHERDLGAVDREHRSARGAERFHRADGVALARQMARHRVRHADAADDKRGQGDQREELGEALDVALELRDALSRVRICQPASGKPVLACCSTDATAASLDAASGRRKR